MRVVVADDSVVLREGVARLLKDAGVDVVGQADDADQLMRTVLAYLAEIGAAASSPAAARRTVEACREPSAGAPTSS